MTTLVIHHPEEQVKKNNKKSFARCLISGVGEGFAIPVKYIHLLNPGIKVVILCNTRNHQRRAEGKLKSITHAGCVGNGMKKYDIAISNIKTVQHHRNDFGKLLQTGVAIF